MSRASKKSASEVWQDRLHRFEESGLTVVSFCAAEGVSEPSFYSWRKRLAGTSRPPSQPEKPVFQAVRIRPDASVLSIELPGGARVEVPSDQLELVRVVVREVARACGTDGSGGA